MIESIIILSQNNRSTILKFSFFVVVDIETKTYSGCFAAPWYLHKMRKKMRHSNRFNCQYSSIKKNTTPSSGSCRIQYRSVLKNVKIEMYLLNH